MALVKVHFTPQGNGTELPDHQTVVIDRVGIEDVVLRKQLGTMYKIVANGIITHKNTGIGKNLLSIDRFLVVGARVCFLWNSHKKPPVLSFYPCAIPAAAPQRFTSSRSFSLCRSYYTTAPWPSGIAGGPGYIRKIRGVTRIGIPTNTCIWRKKEFFISPAAGGQNMDNNGCFLYGNCM